MDGEVVRKEVLLALEYSYEHEDWVNPLSEALRGVQATEAVWRPTAGRKCIWEIVLHLAVWTENIIERMRTGESVGPPEGHWPPLPAACDEAAWASAQKRLWDALAALRAFIETSSPNALLAGPYGLADLLCRFTHNGYHIGQITVLREWYATACGVKNT
jgi:hypothetical protein